MKFLNILLVFISFLFGFVLSHLRISHKIKSAVNNYLIYFGLPLFIFSSITSLKNFKFGNIVLLAFLIITVASIISYVVFKNSNLSRKRKASLFLCSVFGNTGYLGIPLCYAFYGDIGGGIASIFSVVNGVLHYTIGVFFANSIYRKGRYALNEALRFPPLYAAVFAFIALKLDFLLPKLIKDFSLSAIYLAPFVIGISFKYVKFDRSFLSASLFKFIFLPLITFLSAFPLFKNAYLYSFILLAFVPPALTNTLIAVKYKFDDSFAAELTSLTTAIFLFGILIFGIFSRF